MSTISGSCSESLSQQMFEYGLEKQAEQTRLQKQHQDDETQVSKSNIEPSPSPTEPGKGLNIDVFV